MFIVRQKLKFQFERTGFGWDCVIFHFVLRAKIERFQMKKSPNDKFAIDQLFSIDKPKLFVYAEVEKLKKKNTSHVPYIRNIEHA